MNCNTQEDCCSLFALGNFYFYNNGNGPNTIEKAKEEILTTIKKTILDDYIYDVNKEIPSAFIASTLEHQQAIYGDALKALGFTKRRFKSRHPEQDDLFLWFKATYPPGIKIWMKQKWKEFNK